MIERYEQLVRENKQLKAQLETYRLGHYQEFPAWADGGDGYKITPLYAAPQPAGQQPYPEGVREGAPYDDPAFESLCREHEVWGTAAAAMCAVFWEAGKRVADQESEMNVTYQNGWAVPAGWKLVPEKPTYELESEVGGVRMDEESFLHECADHEKIGEICRAVVKYSPPPPKAPDYNPSPLEVSVIGMPEFDALLDHIYEEGTSSEGAVHLANKLVRVAIQSHITHARNAQPAPDVACSQSRESSMVVLERDEHGKPAVWCDPEIADLVSALNQAGIRTVASCSGHGHRPGNIMLADGRELVIAGDFDEARKIDAMFPGINGDPPMVDVKALVEALERIASWPNGGNRSGQTHIQMFAAKTLATYYKGVEL